MGEEGKSEEKKEKKEEKKGGGDKKEDGPLTVVLKVDMHCEGCARKVKKSVKDMPGVEDVKADVGNNKLTVIGKVDPKVIVERVQKKTEKKVELISPLPKKEEGENKKKPEEKETKAEEKKKEKEPSVVTTVLRVYLHCDGCAQSVKKAITKVKGVQSAEPDLKNHNVTVKGTMDPNKLVDYLHRKTRKHVEIVPQKKDDKKEGDKKEGDKKEGGKKEGGEKKDGGGEKKDGENKKGGGDDDKKGGDESKGDGEDKKGEGKKNEIPIPRYVIEYVHPPQLFSDENPNACSIM